MEEALIKRILPHSMEAEQSVIGSMILDRDAILVAGALMDDLAQLTTAKSFGKAQRQHRQMLRHRQPQIGRHPERRQVGAHQRCNVNKVRQHCKQHCHPAVINSPESASSLW